MQEESPSPSGPRICLYATLLKCIQPTPLVGWDALATGTGQLAMTGLNNRLHPRLDPWSYPRPTLAPPLCSPDSPKLNFLLSANQTSLLRRSRKIFTATARDSDNSSTGADPALAVQRPAWLTTLIISSNRRPAAAGRAGWVLRREGPGRHGRRRAGVGDR